MSQKTPLAQQHIRDRQSLRLGWIALFVLLFFCLLIFQFFKIQVIEQEKWTNKANAQHHLVAKEPFKRGVFYSNTSIKQGHPQDVQPLVIDVPKYHLYFDPLNIPEIHREEIARRLSSLLNLTQKEHLIVRAQLEKSSHSRKIIKWLGEDLKEQILNWWNGFARKQKIARNALFFIQDYQRSYPFGKLLGQVLHTVREEKEEKTDRSIPTGGLELIFDSLLNGKNGKRMFLRSPRHAIDTGKVISSPENGCDIYLTINHCLQAIAEEEIAKAVKAANAKSGWAIMMNPKNGEVLALAQYPFFYPSEYSRFFNDAKSLEDTKVKAITDPFEPGSTMKPVTIAIGLMANEELKRQGKKPIFSPKDKIATATCILPGRSKPLHDTKFHSFLNMNMALQKSSNVYVGKLVQRVIQELGVDWYRNALQNVFGFGIKTGIELPSESVGLVPMPGKLHPNGTLEWSAPTPYSLAMGHNILVNSLQMVRAFSIIVNGGYAVKPTLVRKIVKKQSNGTEEVVFDHLSSLSQRPPVSLLDPKISEELIRGMKYVTKPGGAAPKADIFGYTEGGKTATSEKIINGIYSKKNHISTFIGFAPAKDPQFVLMVVIDEPEFKYIPGVGGNQFGGTCAAPAFREISLRSLQFLGVAPDDPFGYPSGDPRHDPNKGDWIKESKELKLLYDQWNS